MAPYPAPASIVWPPPGSITNCAPVRQARPSFSATSPPSVQRTPSASRPDRCTAPTPPGSAVEPREGSDGADVASSSTLPPSGPRSASDGPVAAGRSIDGRAVALPLVLLVRGRLQHRAALVPHQPAPLALRLGLRRGGCRGVRRLVADGSEAQREERVAVRQHGDVARRRGLVAVAHRAQRVRAGRQRREDELALAVGQRDQVPAADALAENQRPRRPPPVRRACSRPSRRRRLRRRGRAEQGRAGWRHPRPTRNGGRNSTY